MNNWFKHALRTSLLLLVSITGFSLYPAPSMATQADLHKQIRILEEDFKRLSSRFYKNTRDYSSSTRVKIDDVDKLLTETNRFIAQDRSIEAIQLLFFNIENVKDNLDDKSIFSFIDLLLNNNEWKLANALYSELKNEGDKSLLATVHFTFAKYHAKRNEWKKVNKLLNGIFLELSPEDGAYAYLLNGSALQHLKKHRPAVNNYKKIPATSRYYPYAQLNIAIANIRQGWWTDAQTTINDLIKLSDKDNSDEIINRLYLVLGYSLLQREYYRDSRDAFRHIGLNSRYTNRALLGIGLSATSQGDFVGGLNALTILKDKKTYDLSVDESYLLVPYVYEKLKQEMTVTASYTDAMGHYQQRIDNLEKIAANHIDFTSISYDLDSSSLIIQNNSLEYGNQYPESFLNNYKILSKFLAQTSNKKIKNLINKQLAKHDKIFQRIVTDLSNERKEHLKSYLNQSRYGLARLFDKSNEANQ